VRTLSADWLVPVEGEPIRDGSVAIADDGTIAAVGPAAHLGTGERFDGCVIVPGLVVGTYFVLVMPLINLERQPVLPTFARSYRLVRGNFWRAVAVWVPIWFVTTAVIEWSAEALEHLGHSQWVHMVAHLVPEALLLPLIALPAVIMTFELVDRDRSVATIRP